MVRVGWRSEPSDLQGRVSGSTVMPQLFQQFTLRASRNQGPAQTSRSAKAVVQAHGNTSREERWRAVSVLFITVVKHR